MKNQDMEAIKKQLQKIIREEKERVLSENTLGVYLSGDYDNYKYGAPVEAAQKVMKAMDRLVAVIGEELWDVGGALEPGFRKLLIPTLKKKLRDKGIKV